MCWWDGLNCLLLAYYFLVFVMLQGEGPLSLHHRHHISVTINTHTILELQTKNNFSQLFFTWNMYFYYSQQNPDILHISLVLKKDPLQISKITGTTHAIFLSNVSVSLQSEKCTSPLCKHYVKYVSLSEVYAHIRSFRNWLYSLLQSSYYGFNFYINGNSWDWKPILGKIQFPAL